MKIVRPDQAAPISAPHHRHGKRQGIGTLIARFAVLLTIIVVLMALAWSR